MTAANARWTLAVRGPLRIVRGDRIINLRPKERAVLSAIAAHHPDPVDTDTITTMVWERAVPASARKSVHNHIARIRRAAEDVIVTCQEGYHLGPDVSVDFDSISGSADEPFADLADTPEVLALRHRISARLVSDEEARLDRLVWAGASPATIEMLEQAVSNHPFREHRWYLLALALAQLGQRREALLTLEAARKELSEIGLLPGDDLRALEQGIVSDDPAVLTRRFTPGGVAPPAETHRSPIPALHPHRADPFVGRSAELEQLQTVWGRVRERQRPELIVISGPAGMGKTRLVDHFTSLTTAANPDVRVLWGRNRGTVDRAYGALVEAVSRLLGTEPELIGQLGSQLDGLFALTAHPRSITSDDKEFARSNLVGSLSALLAALADHPAIWLIDDVHWASPDSLTILEEAIDGIDGSLLIVMTTRTSSHAAQPAVTALTRIVPTTTIDLVGLSVDDLGALFAATDGPSQRPVDLAVAQVVHQRTSGHALYASEIARHARRHDNAVDADGVPPAIRDWVHNRMHGLDDALCEMLRLAAVIGYRVDPTILTRCAPSPEALTASTCDRLVEIGLLAFAANTSGPQQHLELQFSHAITHEIVYESIGPMRAAQLHRQVAEALTLEPPTSRDHAALAHHYGRAGREFSAQAAEHAMLAADQDFGVGAWVQAATLYEIAASTAPSPADRARALVGLGRAHLGAENFADAVRYLDEAIEIARLEGLAMIQAAATLTLVGRAGRGAAIGTSDEHNIARLRTALFNLENHPTGDAHNAAEIAVLLSDLERELGYLLLLRDAEAERSRLFEQAVQRMRTLDPPRPAALARALLGARYDKLGPDQLADRLGDLNEVLAMAPSVIGPQVLLSAHCYRYEDLLRTGDFATAQHSLDDAAMVASRFPDPYWSWVIATWRVVHHMVVGELEVAEQLSFEAFGKRAAIAEAQACLGVNLVTIRLFQKRAGEMIDALRQAVAEHPEVPSYRAALALTASQAGDTTLGNEMLHWFADKGFANLPNDTSRLLGLGSLAHAAADLGDRQAGDALTRLLTPYRDQWIVVAVYGGGGAALGPVSYALGRLAEMANLPHIALEHYNLAAAQSVGAPPIIERIERHRRAVAPSP